MALGPRLNRSDKRYWCKVFRTRHDLVGAICDKDLLDKELEDGKLKIKVSKHFYGGVLISEGAAVKIMGKVTIGNIIGREIVDAAVKGGFITEENIILIDGVPHAQFVRI